MRALVRDSAGHVPQTLQLLGTEYLLFQLLLGLRRNLRLFEILHNLLFLLPDDLKGPCILDRNGDPGSEFFEQVGVNGFFFHPNLNLSDLSLGRVQFRNLAMGTWNSAGNHEGFRL